MIYMSFLYYMIISNPTVGRDRTYTLHMLKGLTLTLSQSESKNVELRVRGGIIVFLVERSRPYKWRKWCIHE